MVEVRVLVKALAPPDTSAGGLSLGSFIVDDEAAVAAQTPDSPAIVEAAVTAVVPPEFDRADLDVDAETDEQRRERFDRTVLEYMQPLYGNALRLTGNQHDAADLVQATFERAFKAFHQYRPGTNLKAWLFKIQSNTFINEYRRKQRQPRLSDSDYVEDWQMHRSESHTSRGLRSAEAEVLEDLPDGAVLEALESLSDDYRQAVLLADVQGFSYKEIADQMGTPVGTVMSRLHRGRRALRLALADYARDHGYLRDRPEEEK